MARVARCRSLRKTGPISAQPDGNTSYSIGTIAKWNNGDDNTLVPSRKQQHPGGVDAKTTTSAASLAA